MLMKTTAIISMIMKPCGFLFQMRMNVWQLECVVMGTVATLMVPIDVLVQKDTLRVDTRHDVSVRVTYKPFFFYLLYCKDLLHRHLFSLRKNLNLHLSALAFASNFHNELERFEDSFLLWISLTDTRNLINSPQPRNLMRKFQILVLFSFSHNSFRRTL